MIAEWKPGEDPESALNQEPRFTRIFVLQNTTNTNLIGKDLTTHIAAYTIQGLFITFDILYIIFGAILLLNVLKHSVNAV